MPVRLRKLVGAVILVVFVVLYAFIAMMIASFKLPGTPGWVQGVYYVAAGLFWVIPAGLLISWMQRP